MTRTIQRRKGRSAIAPAIERAPGKTHLRVASSSEKAVVDYVRANPSLKNLPLSSSLAEDVLVHAQSGREVIQDFVPRDSVPSLLTTNGTGACRRRCGTSTMPTHSRNAVLRVVNLGAARRAHLHAERLQPLRHARGHVGRRLLGFGREAVGGWRWRWHWIHIFRSTTR